jgi:F-type H+-transporting ATPase subunit delta
MTAAAAARRYASALFDVVQQTGQVDAALRDLSGLRDLIASHELLRKVFDTPAVPASRKRAMIDALLAAGGAGEEVRRLLQMMADRDRLALVPEVARAFAARVMVARRQMAAEVVTAAPLADTHRDALAGALKRATGNDVTLSERVDPSIVGGLVARVGSLVFDGSVTRQLERMRLRLLSEV